MFSDGLDARIGLDGQVAEAKDLGTEDLLALVDQTEKMILKEEAVDYRQSFIDRHIGREEPLGRRLE